MKISFKIKETIPDLIADLKAGDGKHWNLEPFQSEVEGYEFIRIVDMDFPGSAALFGCELTEHSNAAVLKTAWSDYSYEFFESKDILTTCTYIGAYRGLLEQWLLPKITPVNIWDEYVESSLGIPKIGHIIMFRQYIQRQSELYDRRIENRTVFSGHRHPRIVADFLKTEK